MIKKYLLTLFTLLYTLTSMGFVLPFLWSSASTELVLLGITYLSIVMPLVYYAVFKSYVKLFKKEN